jgi:8-oxo-dGTP diphosphatase
MKTARDRTIQVVAGLLYRNGRLLVCQRRANGAFPLQWEFPGGKVESGESDRDALDRELREELAIQVRGAALIYQNDHCYAGGPMVSLHFHHIYDFDGEAKNLIFEQISWVQLPDLSRLDFLEGDRPIIEKLLVDGEAALLRS